MAISADQLTTIVSSTSLFVLTNNVKSEDFFSDIKRVDHATTISFSPKLWLRVGFELVLSKYTKKTKIFGKKNLLENFLTMTHKFQNRPLGRCNWRWRYGATISSLAINLLRFWCAFWDASRLAIDSHWTLSDINIGHFCQFFDRNAEKLFTLHLFVDLYLRQPVVFIIFGREIYVFEVKSVLVLNCIIGTNCYGSCYSVYHV